jgi:hypothetical protein
VRGLAFCGPAPRLPRPEPPPRRLSAWLLTIFGFRPKDSEFDLSRSRERPRADGGPCGPARAAEKSRLQGMSVAVMGNEVAKLNAQ